MGKLFFVSKLGDRWYREGPETTKEMLVWDIIENFSLYSSIKTSDDQLTVHRNAWSALLNLPDGFETEFVIEVCEEQKFLRISGYELGIIHFNGRVVKEFGTYGDNYLHQWPQLGDNWKEVFGWDVDRWTKFFLECTKTRITYRSCY